MSHTEHTFSAKCPSCKTPFHYTEVTHIAGVNDGGFWEVECSKCQKLFSLDLCNPDDSYAEYGWQVRERRDYSRPAEAIPLAMEVVEHNIERRKTDWNFDCDAIPLYLCESTGNALDASAYVELKTSADKIETAWRRAEPALLAGHDGGRDHVLVRVDVPCRCGQAHKATFYAEKRLGVCSKPLPERCLLAAIQGTRLESSLNGLFSKTEIMQLLEKLVIRWHLTADRILIAAPFVGHQYMKTEDKRKIWDWLIRNLDPTKATLLTRKATYASFKNAIEAEGLDYEEMKSYGLDDKLVSDGKAKQDFHAKFYVGLSSEATEVLSGSANLLRGPSIENISFTRMSQTEFMTRYLQKLKVTIPQASPRLLPYEVVREKDGQWNCLQIDAKSALWLRAKDAR